MQYPTTKKSLNQQARPAIQAKLLKNHDRILYVNGLFTPPKSEEGQIVSAKETEEWRSLFTMVLIAGFGAIMIVISVIGSYGINATNQLEAYEQKLTHQIESMRIEKALKHEEINALKTNPEYIELVARKNLGLVHASEFIYYLPPSEKNHYHKDN